jgi:cobalamin biosynthesis Co2+ chelatase CbiK
MLFATMCNRFKILKRAKIEASVRMRYPANAFDQINSNEYLKIGITKLRIINGSMKYTT